MKKTKYQKGVFVIENCLTKQECDDLILFSEQRGYEEATVTTSSGPQMIKGVRDNDRVMYMDVEMAQRLWQKVKEFIPTEFDRKKAYGLNELFRFYRYENGQRFNWHKDGAFYRDMGDQSYLTLLFYLNGDFEGGETSFEGFDVVPKQGDALIFKHELRHKGCSVSKGIKYVLRTDVMYKK